MQICTTILGGSKLIQPLKTVNLSFSSLSSSFYYVPLRSASVSDTTEAVLSRPPKRYGRSTLARVECWGQSTILLRRRLVARLTDAAERIDAALYHLNSAPVADALIKAHNRGIQVRLVTETDNIDEAEIGRLREVGIPVIADDGDSDSYMHHKFIVIDERYVWTGSYNTTYNGAYKNNNNVIFIDSVPLSI